MRRTPRISEAATEIAFAAFPFRILYERFGMRFTGDADKARRNLAKHGISFELAQRVWDDPHVLIAYDRREEGEDRWHAIGTVEGVKVVLVVHTYRLSMSEEVIRIIGARRATKTERRRYEQQTS